MRIPHVGGTRDTFGNRGPDRMGPAQFDTRGMDAGLAGLADAAQRVGGIAQQMQQQRQAEDDALARAKASNALLDDELQTRLVTEDVQARIADGSLDWRKAGEEYEYRQSQRQAPTIDNLDPADAERFQGGLKRNRIAGAATVGQVADGARRAEFRSQFDAALDTLGKLAGQPNADIDKINAQAEAYAPMAAAAQVDPAVVAAKIQGFKDRNWTNHATGRLIAGRDSMDALNALESDLSTGAYAEKLDTDKRNAILSQVLTAKGRLEAKAQHEADKFEASAERALTAFEAQVSTSVAAPIEKMTDWSETIKRGTPEQQARFRELLAGEVEVRGVLAKPPAEQQAYLQTLRAKQQRDGATIAQQGNLRRLESAVESNLKLMREAPLAFHGERTGQPVQPLDLAAVLSGNVDAVRSQVGERMATLATLRKQYGPEVGTAPLLPQEATAIGGALAQATPGQAIKLYGTLATVFGDPQAYRAAIQQIAPDAPVRAYVGLLHERTPKGAQLILQGEALLNRSKSDKAEDGKAPAFPMPPAAEFTAAMDEALGDAFRGRPGAYEVAMQVVRAGYAGSAATDGDMSGEIDTKRLKNVIRFAIGDVAEVNGSQVVMPAGMDEDTFADKLEAAWSGLQLPAGAPRELDDYRLQQAGDGSYYVVHGGAFLHGANNRPVVLKVGP